MEKSAFLIVVVLACTISLAYAGDCHFDLPGDLNYDCEINLVDVSWLAQLWLIDCHAEPLDVECIPLDMDEDGFDVISDCNDHNAAVYPGATEVCDNYIDDDCDDLIDCDDDDCTASPSCGSWWYSDGDGDTYGDPGNSLWSVTQPGGYVLDNTDCDDGNFTVNPGAPEICDGLNNDCDLETDEDLIAPACALQNGVCSGSVKICGGGSGWLLCDGSNYGPNYEANNEMTCDGMDNDCDGATDEGNPGGGAPCDGPDPDLCEEGIITCSGGSLNCSDTTDDTLEICDDFFDNDCDGLIDGADPDCN